MERLHSLVLFEMLAQFDHDRSDGCLRVAPRGSASPLPPPGSVGRNDKPGRLVGIAVLQSDFSVIITH